MKEETTQHSRRGNDRAMVKRRIRITLENLRESKKRRRRLDHTGGGTGAAEGTEL